MSTYAVVARAGWDDPDVVVAAIAAARDGADGIDGARLVSGWVVEAAMGAFGILGIVQADGPEAVRRLATASGFVVDEISRVVR